jgi:elongation of very long chain fatty acids protein 6
LPRFACRIHCSLLSFEVKHDPAHVLHWMMESPHVPILAVVLYGIGIVLGQSYFRDRPAWNWRQTMSIWNLGLAVFSFIGFIRVLPYTVHILGTNTLQQALCTDPESTYGSGSTGLWVNLFILSKFP